MGSKTATLGCMKCSRLRGMNEVLAFSRGIFDDLVFLNFVASGFSPRIDPAS